MTWVATATVGYDGREKRLVRHGYGRTKTADDQWLATLATSLSTRTLQGVRACLNRAVRRAMARDKVKRNVVELTEVPVGLPGRPLEGHGCPAG